MGIDNELRTFNRFAIGQVGRSERSAVAVEASRFKAESAYHATPRAREVQKYPGNSDGQYGTYRKPCHPDLALPPQ
jgi:hypothetical protein